MMLIAVTPQSFHTVCLVCGTRPRPQTKHGGVSQEMINDERATAATSDLRCGAPTQVRVAGLAGAALPERYGPTH